ncbi:hypothetical protein VNO77_19860 [Canavalia gladiata]|uniref:Uncharacterized protein n=1 Tax=Canavalia gladiata TaxID=3824 RepID=A0AAN9LP50_CANGL
MFAGNDAYVHDWEGRDQGLTVYGCSNAAYLHLPGDHNIHFGSALSRHATKIEVRFMVIASGNNSLVEVKQPFLTRSEHLYPRRTAHRHPHQVSLLPCMHAGSFKVKLKLRVQPGSLERCAKMCRSSYILVLGVCDAWHL